MVRPGRFSQLPVIPAKPGVQYAAAWVETVEATKQRKPVADYVREHDQTLKANTWETWLQTHRIELNAMTTPQLIGWLDRKMAEFGDGKLIPPPHVTERDLADRIERKLRDAIRDRILREADFEGQVASALAASTKPDGTTIAHEIELLFEREPDRQWRDAVEAAARKLTKSR